MKANILIRDIEAEIQDSVKWIGEHFPDSYAQANNCEKCRIGGLTFTLALLKGTTQEEEYQRAISRIKKRKQRPVAKRAVKKSTPKKRVVVRRKSNG